MSGQIIDLLTLRSEKRCKIPWEKPRLRLREAWLRDYSTVMGKVHEERRKQQDQG
jgi:hypothetical protein